MNSEKFYRALEGIKENQIEPKNTITEMKNTLEGLNITLDDIKGWISEMKDRVVEITEDEQKKKKRIKRNKDSLRDF